MRRISLVLLFVLLCSSVRAGDEDSWRLVQPTVDEYLAGLEPITQAFINEYLGPDTIWRLLETELNWRYADALDYETLERAYNVLNKGYDLPFVYSPLISLPLWNMRIVSSWLAAHPTDLSQVDTLEFGAYTIQVEDDFDFDGDSVNDLLLDVQSESFGDHWLAAADQNSPSAYRFESLLIPYFDRNDWIHNAEFTVEGQSNIDGLQIDDVNADGKAEIIAAYSDPYPSSSEVGSYIRIMVMGWDEGRMDYVVAAYQEEGGKQVLRPTTIGVDYAWEPYSPKPWMFENIDRDEPLELIVSQGLKDNFGCLFSEKKIYDWDGQYYLLAESESGFDETFYCAMRQAEEAVIEDADYVSAIPYYELAVERFDEVQSPTENDAQLIAYAQERLALAYVMVGRPEDARTLLESMGRQPDDTIAAQVLKIPTADLTPLNTCRIVFDYLETNFSYEAGQHSYHHLPLIGVVEPSFDIQLPRAYPVLPATVGCDYHRMLEHQSLILSTEQPLAPQPTATTTPPEREVEQNQDAVIALSQLHSATSRAFIEANFQQVVNLTNGLEDLVLPADDMFSYSTQSYYALRYYRALALEALDRPDDALAEYVSIYDAMPDSAWGMLGALHFEKIDS